MANETVLKAMQEYAEAVRGDWSDFDGRSNRFILESFVSALRGGPESVRTLDEWRADLGVCLYGGGHWTEYCDANCEQRERGA